MLNRALTAALGGLLTLAVTSPLAAGTGGESSELRWYKGNTHTHTINSDGDSAPDVVARWYKEHGYQFLFITDHEYMTDPAPLNALLGAAERFLVLPGQEITQTRKGSTANQAHLNALFTREAIQPFGERVCYTWCVAQVESSVTLGTTLDTNIAKVRAQGGIAQVNHPNFAWSLKLSDLDNLPNGTLLEIWNGHGQVNNLGGDDGAGDMKPAAEGFWDYALSRGKIIWGVGADDAHSFTEVTATQPAGAAPGRAWIMVRARALTPAAIRTAIEKGDFYASTGIELSDSATDSTGITLTIIPPKQYPPRYTTRFIGQDGKLLAEVAGANPTYRFRGDETYVRAAVIDSNGKRAWTQPVFLDGRR